MTVFELSNALAEAQIRAFRKQEPRRWWYRWWAINWEKWAGDEEVLEPEGFRPTESAALARIRHRAQIAEYIRFQQRLARKRFSAN